MTPLAEMNPPNGRRPNNHPIPTPSFAEFLSLAGPGLRIPVVIQIPAEGRTPLGVYRAFRTTGRGALLENGREAGRSIVAVDIGEEWMVQDGEGGADPFALIRERCGANPIVPNPLLRRFQGGMIGWLSYDVARTIERLPSLAADDLRIPLCYFQTIESFVEFDHERGMLTIATLPMMQQGDAANHYQAMVDRLLVIAETIAAIVPDEEVQEGDEGEGTSPSQADPGTFAATLTADQFSQIVRRTREYIFAGDIFQANLSVRFHRPFPNDPVELYRCLRKINPSPFMAFIETPDCAVASASPELLLRVEGRQIETRPIAGTRRRGHDDAQDEANIAELLGNEKERAEHLMLVDLERNDIGRVASFGTVQVNELMAVEKYSHVIHIVSNIRGQLRDGMDTLDAIRACFPGGTITGAPKVRSMEIIEELEPTQRGIYTGSIGWIGWDGNAELNIAIRTLLVKDGVAYLQAGAGIVADSVPEHEYRESLRKAQAAMNAVEQALERNGKEGNAR